MGSGFSGRGGGSCKGEIIRTAVNSKVGPGLGDIPERCVAMILSCLEPAEICRLAAVNKAFYRASSADFVWETKLPQNYHILLHKLFNINTNTVRLDQNLVLKKHIYAMLRGPNRFAAASKEVWLETNKGGVGVCVSVSWKGLKITGIDDRRYWTYVSTNESRFHSIAYLQQIWWLEVAGDLEFDFPAGTYSLFFRLQLGSATKRQDAQGTSPKQVIGWDIKPVRFQLWTSNGQQAMSRCYLRQQGKWIHYHVGDFLVHKSNVPIKIKFSMSQIDCTHLKGGLCLDSVLIYPCEIGERLRQRC